MRKARSRTLITFGRLVRIYRDAAGLTQKELARAIDYTNGWISALETGQLRPRGQQVEALERALSLPPGALMTVFEQLDGESLPGWMREWIPEEAEADILRWVELLVVPGILQTEDYAREVLGGDESAVAARMRRQDIFTRDDTPAMHFVIDEMVLNKQFGDTKVMREQLEHLIAAISPPQITLQVVRSAVNPHVAGAFVLATADDSEVAYVETAIRGIVTGSKEDMASLWTTWETVRTFALPQQESIDLIKKTIEERWT